MKKEQLREQIAGLTESILVHTLLLKRLLKPKTVAILGSLFGRPFVCPPQVEEAVLISLTGRGAAFLPLTLDKQQIRQCLWFGRGLSLSVVQGPLRLNY